MMKMIEIKVTGEQGVGKTKVLEMIKAVLCIAGYRVVAVNDEEHWLGVELKK